MMWFGWVIWLFTVMGAGWIALMRVTHISFAERAGTSIILGATVLPLTLFVMQSLLHAPVLGQGAVGWGFTAVLSLLLIFPLIVFAMRHVPVKPAHDQAPRLGLFKRTLIFALVATLAVFAFQIGYGLRLPVFGWDEYSFWLYAAKALDLHAGTSTAMLQDAYNTYPLGFPYLVAWMYHLTGGIAIVKAKWVTPILTISTLTALHQILRRIGVSPLYALVAVALAVWGTRVILWYNFVAFGEMSYVDTYVLGVLYAVAWMNRRNPHDLVIAGGLLGLSSFLRVDGIYIALFTVILLWLTADKAARRSMRPRLFGTFLVAAVLPVIPWQVFSRIYHANGWTTRLSATQIVHRLQQPFLGVMSAAIWRTITDFSTYPIILVLFALIALFPFHRRRDVLFLMLLSLAQIAYLFFAYLTVFSQFEALHASSMDRYLLRIDPIVAVAFALFVASMSARKPAQRQAE